MAITHPSLDQLELSATFFLGSGATRLRLAMIRRISHRAQR